ncbi:MAG: transglutaminase domain-containing protein [Acutalibacteraceae bacterium]
MKVAKKISLAIIALISIFYIIGIEPIENAIKNTFLEENNSDIELSMSEENLYWYNNLTQAEQKAYRVIHSKIVDFPKKIAINKLSTEELSNVFQALSYDNPHFLFLGNSSTLESTGYTSYFIPQYTMSKSTYNEYLSAMNNVLAQMSVQTAGMSDYEKELYVHDYLVENCQYNDTGSDIRCTAFGALINNQANCEGYSRATQFLLNSLGVKCRVVIGDATDSTGKTEGHMWNVVSIGGKEYNLDVTWDDHELKGTTVESKPVSHMYMNITTSEIAVSHTVSDIKYNDGCVYDDANYYKMSNIYFDKYDKDTKNAIVDEIIKQVSNGGNNIEIKFSSTQAYENAETQLFKGQDIYRLISRANLSSTRKMNANNISYKNTPEKQIIRIFFNF